MVWLSQTRKVLSEVNFRDLAPDSQASPVLGPLPALGGSTVLALPPTPPPFSLSLSLSPRPLICWTVCPNEQAGGLPCPGPASAAPHSTDVAISPPGKTALQYPRLAKNRVGVCASLIAETPLQMWGNNSF